jgi:hypothetical protein
MSGRLERAKLQLEQHLAESGGKITQTIENDIAVLMDEAARQEREIMKNGIPSMLTDHEKEEFTHGRQAFASQKPRSPESSFSWLMGWDFEKRQRDQSYGIDNWPLFQRKGHEDKGDSNDKKQR